jgi:RHS repeat-associated protein
MRIKGNFLRKFMSSFLMGIFLLSTCVPATLAEEIVHFYHNDHLGSPLAITDEEGNVVWRRDYKPFGQEIELGGETTFNTHTYTGKEFDAETGFYYYGARYYDPGIGRFISVDPADANPSNPQSWNRYVYSLNNPYRYVDPDGKLVWDVIDIACFGYSVYRFADDPSWSTALDLGLDAAGLLPVIPALGTIKRTGTLLHKAAKADEVLDAAKVAKAGKKKVAQEGKKALGRTGKQSRLRELGSDPKVSSGDRGWIKQDMNQIERGKRKNIRVPPGKELAHRRGFEAKKGFDYEHSDLQVIDNHKLQHKHEGY